MVALKQALMVQDDPKDINLSVASLAEHNPANEVVNVRDRVALWDCFYPRGSYARRPPDNPALIHLGLKIPCMDGSRSWSRPRRSPNWTGYRWSS